MEYSCAGRALYRVDNRIEHAITAVVECVANPRPNPLVIMERACIIRRRTGSQSDARRAAEVELEDARPTAAAGA